MSLKHNSLLQFNNSISIMEYAEGYRLYDLRRGRSCGREWKATVFFVLSLLMLFLLTMEQYRMSDMPVTAIVLLISAYMCCHYVYILPGKAKLKGEHIYKSSRLLSAEYRFEMYEEYFMMENEYESVKRYYTQLTDCIETNRLFVLMGGMEKKLIVISKQGISQNEAEKLSRLFQKEMPGRYRIVKKANRK